MILDQLIRATVIVFGIALSSSYYLQSWRVYKLKSSQEISIPAYAVSLAGTIVWTLYGFYVQDLVIITGYIFGVVGSLLVLLLTLYYRRRNKTGL